MRRSTIYNLLFVVVCMNARVGVCAVAGELRAWGSDHDGQVSTLPAGGDYVAVAAGDAHGLALKSDGTVVAWGQNDDGECNVPAGTYKAIGAGADFSLAIRTDGSIAAWGNDLRRQVSSAPDGNDFIAVDGGEFFAVALRADGTVVCWGSDRWGQVTSAPTKGSFNAVVAGDDHAVALHADGSLVVWGYWGAVEGTPSAGTFTAIGAGGRYSLAVRQDGAIVWWGSDTYGYGLARVPTGRDYVDVAAGYLHCLALRSDGSVVGWGAGVDTSGHPHWGQANPPAANDYAVITGGLYFSLAIAAAAEDVNEVAIADDFNDNAQGTIWQYYGDNLSGCWLEEVNERLELRSTAKALGVPAFYLSDDWRLDPTADFSFKVSFHYGLLNDGAGWVSVGLTPDADDPDVQHVQFGAGCTRLYPHLWYEVFDEGREQINFADRRLDDGVLYVSYDAALDELYLSDAGYGGKDAWVMIPGLLQTSWGGQPVHLFLGGGADTLEVNSGDAYLDDFVLDTGTLARSMLSEVHRFWSPVTGRHFYTISESERNKLIDKYSHVWAYEGPVYRAATTPYLAGLAPVYRFWSEKSGSHLYTISEREKDKLVDNFPDVWTFEGIVFYAYPESQQPLETKPVYRFWKQKGNTHFYTISETEKDKLVKEFSEVYTFEGVAFYAYAL